MNNNLQEIKDISRGEPNYGSFFLWCFELYCLAVMGLIPIDVTKIDAGYVFRIIGQPVFWRTQLIGFVGFFLWKTVHEMNTRYHDLKYAPRAYLVWSSVVALLLNFMIVGCFIADIRILSPHFVRAYAVWYVQAILFGIATFAIQRTLAVRLLKSLFVSLKAS